MLELENLLLNANDDVSLALPEQLDGLNKRQTTQAAPK